MPCLLGCQSTKKVNCSLLTTSQACFAHPRSLTNPVTVPSSHRGTLPALPGHMPRYQAHKGESKMTSRRGRRQDSWGHRERPRNCRPRPGPEPCAFTHPGVHGHTLWQLQSTGRLSEDPKRLALCEQQAGPSARRVGCWLWGPTEHGIYTALLTDEGPALGRSRF